jgi:hypothetical protein
MLNVWAILGALAGIACVLSIVFLPGTGGRADKLGNILIVILAGALFGFAMVCRLATILVKNYDERFLELAQRITDLETSARTSRDEKTA